ncbi:MAG: polysaccharide biosynthesis protein, partial [Clostridiales bacterium]|nr:polysaccharide biosynthesis protein [Clostridiales bacterium]
MVKAMKMSILLFLDIILINISYIAAFLIRFEFNVASPVFEAWFSTYLNHFLILTGIKIAVLYFFGMYKSLWKYAGIEELLKTVAVTFVSTAVVIFYLVLVQDNMPRGVYIITFILDIYLIGGVRLGYRFIKGARGMSLFKSGENKINRVMVIGAGDAGSVIIKELRNHSELKSKPVVVIDDNKDKLNRRIAGVPIAGTRHDIVSLAKKYRIDEIIIAIPSANKKDIRDIVEKCNKTQCKLKILPGLYELIDEKVSVSKLRNVDIEDLLGRESVQVNLEGISGYLQNKVVLVTGGGGSIGSELCRQIAKFKPKKLIALDVYENSIFELQNEMARTEPDLDFKPLIASVRDSSRMRDIFKEYM